MQKNFRVNKEFEIVSKLYASKLIIHYGILILTIFLGVNSQGIFRLLMITCGAIQFVALFAALHNTSHYTLFGCKFLDTNIGRILASSLLTTYTGYRHVHLRHHSKLRTVEDPQEVIFISKNRFFQAILLCIASLIGAAIFIWVRIPLIGLRSDKWLTVLIELSFSWSLWIIFFYTYSNYSIVIFQTIILAIVWGSLLDITYHQGLPVENKITSSRSIDSDFFGLVFLFGDNRHAEHHIYPMIPGVNLNKLSKAVRADLVAKGICYEKGYASILLSLIFKNPLFLPPNSKK